MRTLLKRASLVLIVLLVLGYAACESSNKSTPITTATISPTRTITPVPMTPPTKTATPPFTNNIGMPEALTSQNSIGIVAPAEVTVGQSFTIVVYANNLNAPLGYLDVVDIAFDPNISPDPTSWNLGEIGGDYCQKDGFWVNVPDELFPPPTHLFFMDLNHVQVNVSLLGHPPVGLQAGTSGALFNLKFSAVSAGTATLEFERNHTDYMDPYGTVHNFTKLVGATVTIK